MTSSYENIYSKFLGLVTDHKLLALPEYKAIELMDEILNLVKGKPKINRLFKELVYDNEAMAITYTLRDSIDELNQTSSYDQNFVENVFANGMVVVWFEKIVNSDENVRQYIGDKETKFYSQANHMDSVRELLSQARKFLDRDFIRDHGWNAWVQKNL